MKTDKISEVIDSIDSLDTDSYGRVSIDRIYAPFSCGRKVSRLLRSARADLGLDVNFLEVKGWTGTEFRDITLGGKATYIKHLLLILEELAS